MFISSNFNFFLFLKYLSIINHIKIVDNWVFNEREGLNLFVILTRIC